MKPVIVTTCAAAAAAALVACGTATETTQPVETSVSSEVATPATSATSAAPQSAAELPGSVAGYTDEARQELAEDGITEADVERVLAAANANEQGVEIEWDDSGYYEIEFQDIDIDIRPDGTVTDVDR